MSRITAKYSKVLFSKPTVVTRAVFWKIPHDSGAEDICLKLGRYKKSAFFSQDEEAESLQPKSELTLQHEEFKALIELLQLNYEPFRQGVKAFIPLDQPFENENAKQIRALFSLPNKKDLIKFVLDNDVIPDELMVSLNLARRVRAVREFESMLLEDLRESPWQKWFEANSWVLGSEFVRILDERDIDTQHISDFLMEAYDGFLDVVEIKRPEGGMNFWSPTLDHGNHVPSIDLIKAFTQASRYIYEVELEANSVKFQQRVGGIKTVKPRCVLIFGRSNDWNDKQIEAYRILNSSFHNLTILTYDHVLVRARCICGIDD
ncbi:MAG: Shedu anti-phage system protein SduA domain-containing protein [Burkholderiaceae bacterium]